MKTIITKHDLQELAQQKFFHAGLFDNDYQSLLNKHYELGKNTADTGLILSANAHIWGALYPLQKFGSTSQQELLTDILNADIITGHAITEPNAGSDVDGMTATALKISDGYLLNGLKCYITNAPIADWIIVYAKAEEGISAFLVAKSDNGVNIRAQESMSAFKCSPMGEIKLNDCFIPMDRLVGHAGSGKSIMQSTLEHERCFLFAGIVGVMEHHLIKLIQFCRQRKTSQGRLSQLQNINHQLAMLRTQIDTIKRWLDYCVELKHTNKRLSMASSQTKIVASESFMNFCQSAIQIMGAIGLEQHQGLCDLVLDAAACRLLSGSNEIQKNIIAAFIGAS